MRVTSNEEEATSAPLSITKPPSIFAAINLKGITCAYLHEVYKTVRNA